MGFEGIHNYYEQPVFNRLAGMELAARYVRHNVDMIFNMTADE